MANSKKKPVKKTTAPKSKVVAKAAAAKARAAETHKKIKEHKVTQVAANNPIARKLAGFGDFIRERGVVGLAVGLAIGTAATVFVKQIVDSVITPAVGLLIGDKGFDSWNITIEIAGRSGDFAFGTLANGFMQFMAVAAVIYFVVMGLGLDKLDKKKEE